MIAGHWQDLVAGLVALVALIYYVRRRLRARGAACEGCPSGACDAPVEPREAPLLTIEGSRPAPTDSRPTSR